MSRLDGPRSRRRMAPVLAIHIETKWRIDDPPAHELRPEQVYRRSGKLRVRCQQAGKRLAFPFSWIGFVPIQDESRRHVRFVAGYAQATLSTQRIAAIVVRPRRVPGAHVPDDEFLLPAKHRTDTGFSEERRLPPEIGTLLFREPEVDLLQMAAAVMARNALQIQAEKNLRGPHRDLIASVLVIHVVPVALHHTVAGNEAGGSGGPVGERVGGDHVAHEVVVGDSQFQRLVDVVVESRDTLLVLRVIAEQVAKEVGPAVEEWLFFPAADALSWQCGNQRVDNLVPLVRIGILKETADLFWSRQPPR